MYIIIYYYSDFLEVLSLMLKATLARFGIQDAVWTNNGEFKELFNMWHPAFSNPPEEMTCRESCVELNKWTPVRKLNKSSWSQTFANLMKG